MDADTCAVEGTIILEEEQTMDNRQNGGSVDDLVPHRMIVAEGDLATGEPTEGPKVLEMSCEAENNTENTTDLQKYASKLRENTTVETDGAVLKERNYEESATRARSETTDHARVSSKSLIQFEENERIRKADGGPAMAEYNAKSEEKHETSVTTTEPVGDGGLVTRTKSSQRNVSKTCRRIEEIDDDGGAPGVITDSSAREECAQASSSEKDETENIIIKKMEKSHKTERSETKIIGSGGDATVLDKYETLLSDSSKKGASIDLGAFGEIKLSTQISSAENTMERDFLMGLNFNSDYSKTGEGSEEEEEEEEEGSVGNVTTAHEDRTKYKDTGGTGKHWTHAHTEYSPGRGGSSSFLMDGRQRPSRMAQESDDMDYNEKIKPPPFRPDDRKSADDLIKRILAESKQESSGVTKPQRIRVDMGGGGGLSQENKVGPSFSSLPPTLDTSSSSSRQEGQKGSGREAHKSLNCEQSCHEETAPSPTMAAYSEGFAFTERAVGAERRRTPAEADELGETEDEAAPSLLQRRLGVENRLENIFTSTEFSTSSSAAAGVGYASKKTLEKDEFDELDQEINAIRSKYKDINSKRYQTLYGEDDEEEEAFAGTRTRGKFTRQGYVEDSYMYGNEPAELFDDEDFIPRRREETEEVVKERTTEIRNVVEKQSTVLAKLKEASDSFDELTNEIRSIKQQFIENQARREFILDDGEKIDIDLEPPRRGRYRRTQSYDYGANQGYVSYSNRTRQLDRELESDGVYEGRSLALVPTGGYKPYKSRYSELEGQEDEGMSYSPRTSNKFAYKRSQYGRSKSLYDDTGAGFEDQNGVEGRREGRYHEKSGTKEEGDEPEETQVKQYGPYGEITNRPYGGGVTSGGDFDYTSYRRASDTDYSSSYSSRYSSSLTSDYSTSNGRYGGYSSKYGGAARQGFMAMRSRTLGNDYSISYDSPSSPGSTFSSRFLNKVREDRGLNAEQKSPKTRDKPFKSRFLRKSFDTDYSSSSTTAASSSSSSYISRFKSNSSEVSSSTNSSTSGIGSTASSSSDSSNKPESNTEAGSAEVMSAE